jgi:hypothetical protein
MKKIYILIAALGLSNAVLNAQSVPEFVEGPVSENAVTESVTEPVDVLMTEGNNVPAKEPNTPWYDEFCHGVGLDWSIDEINTLGIYYEFSHTVDSYSHLIGIGYTASF